MDFLCDFDDEPLDELFMAAVEDYEQSETNTVENTQLEPIQGPSETQQPGRQRR